MGGAALGGHGERTPGTDAPMNSEGTAAALGEHSSEVPLPCSGLRPFPRASSEGLFAVSRALPVLSRDNLYF